MNFKKENYFYISLYIVYYYGRVFEIGGNSISIEINIRFDNRLVQQIFYFYSIKENQIFNYYMNYNSLFKIVKNNCFILFLIFEISDFFKYIQSSIKLDFKSINNRIYMKKVLYA